MHKGIFPDKKNPNMSDDIWETYCMMVWCNNSLNATEGIYRARHYRRKGDKVNEMTAEMLSRAQDVILFLLKESGRLDRYDKYKKEKEKNK